MTKIKGVVHIHSAPYSYDGEMTIIEIVKWYKNHGYSFMMLTEHVETMNKNKMEELVSECEKLSNREFIIIPGLEIPTNDGWHILALGINDLVGNASIGRLIDNIHNRGGIAVLAHPSRYDHGVDRKLLLSLDGIEIWNPNYDGKFAPNLKNLRLLGRARLDNKQLIGYCGQDFHNFFNFTNLSICISTDELSEKNILLTLKQGRFLIKSTLITLNPMESASVWKNVYIILARTFFHFMRFSAITAGRMFSLVGKKPPKKLSEFAHRILYG